MAHPSTSLGHPLQRAEHDAEDVAGVPAGSPTPRPRAPRSRHPRSRPLHGRRPHPVDRRRLADRVVPVHGAQHGRSARRVVGARLLGLLGDRTRSTKGSCARCDRSSAAIPEEQRRPLYITEFGVRGLGTFEGETSFEPGFWPDGTPMSATNAAAFQQAWFNIRAAQLGFSGTVKWDVYPAKYDAGHPGSLDARPCVPKAGRSDPSTTSCS